MTISAAQVKQLREMTGAGMMDCKKALVEVDGNIDEAVEYLQKKGMAAAAKKAGRVAAEGLIGHHFSGDGTQAVMVEVNCETDFVARNDQFKEFVSKVTDVIGSSDAADLDAAMALPVDGGTLETFLNESIQTIGENIQIRRFVRVNEPEGTVAGYLHAGAQIGVLVRVKGNDGAGDFGRDIAMHIAAMNPICLSADDIPAADRAKQEEIFTAIVREDGTKKEEIIPKIVMGKMGKWAREQNLMDQAFVKNSDLSVAQYQEQTGGVSIVGFDRFGVGDGIEKEESNLADEVAAQLNG